MTRTFILIICFSLGLQSFGQNNKYGISIIFSNPYLKDNSIYSTAYLENVENISQKDLSFSTGLLANYKINDTTTVRLCLGITNITKEIFQDEYNSGMHDEILTNYQQHMFHFSPGITWGLRYHKFNFYTGIEASFNLIRKFNEKAHDTRSDSLTGDPISWFKETSASPGGYSMGMGALFGLHYTPVKWLSIGTEFSPFITYTKLKGKFTRESSSSYYPNIHYDPSINYTDKEAISIKQRFSLILSFWF